MGCSLTLALSLALTLALLALTLVTLALSLQRGDSVMSSPGIAKLNPMRIALSSLPYQYT